MRNHKKLASYVAALALLTAGTAVAGGGGGNDLSSVAGTLTEQIKTLANLLIIVAYVAGIGFCLVGVIQFKAHKDNPAQTPLSKPVVYLAVGACLLFLPALMGTAGNTIFGGDQSSADSIGDGESVIQSF